MLLGGSGETRKRESLRSIFSCDHVKAENRKMLDLLPRF
jgi:hypothetical protein